MFTVCLQSLPVKMATSIAARCCKMSFWNALAGSLRRPDICHLDVRHYARGTWRGLRDVLTADEEERQWKDTVRKSDPRKNPYVPFENADPIHRSMVSTSRIRPEKVKTPSSSKSVIGQQREANVLKVKFEKNSPRYEKLEEGDKRFGQAILSTKSRKEREKKNIILLEGYRLIKDALECGATAKCVYFSDKDLLEKLPFCEDVPLYKVQYRHFKIWSDTQTPAGIMAIFEKPKTGECPSPLASSLPITLICDNIRDPGNMGTLIRTATAVGCQRILTTKGCVDVWEPKVLRSGMGSHFHIPILAGIPWEILLNYVSDDTQVLVAETGKMDTGHSGRGSLTVDQVDELLTASHDIEGVSDSRDFVREKYKSFPSTSRTDMKIDKSFLKKDIVKQFDHVPLQYVRYNDLKCSSDNVAVIIGGETTGVSQEARKFAFDHYGQCVTIPMSPVVNSLNSAIAASVILYEVRKHLI